LESIGNGSKYENKAKIMILYSFLIIAIRDRSIVYTNMVTFGLHALVGILARDTLNAVGWKTKKAI